MWLLPLMFRVVGASTFKVPALETTPTLWVTLPPKSSVPATMLVAPERLAAAFQGELAGAELGEAAAGLVRAGAKVTFWPLVSNAYCWLAAWLKVAESSAWWPRCTARRRR